MNKEWPFSIQNQLVDLYNMGLSMRDIGSYIGKNKNQVIGKLHRLKRRFPEKFTRVTDTAKINNRTSVEKIRMKKPGKYG